MLNIPSRRPDFNKTFPTHQDFEATKNNIALAKSRNTPLRWLTLSSRSRDDACLAGKSKIVPSAAGRIEQILFVIPKGGDYDRRLKRHFTNLVRHLEGKDENRNYIVVCKPEQKRHLHGWFTEYGVSDSNISFVSSPHFNVTLWAQDAYVAVGINDQPLPILHEGVSFARAEDMSIADDIAAQELVMATQSYLYFQGGNILGGPTATLVGYDYIARNCLRTGLESESAVIDAFQAILGADTKIVPLGWDKSGHEGWYRRGILSGFGQQPIFHIDMYVTPTGEICKDTGKEIVMLGRPRAAFRATGKWSDLYEFDDDRYDSLFQKTEDQLNAAGFTVKHLPLWLTWGDLGGKVPYPKYYVLSFNNVVVENYVKDNQSVRNVILPSFAKDYADFGIDWVGKRIREELYEAAKQTWQDIGFTVMDMDGLEDLAYADGSVHCITKVLKRN